jgi:hypothetical protein
MSCCGKSRAQSAAAPSRQGPSQAAPFKSAVVNLSAPIAVQQVGTVTFEYTGRTRLTVIGPVTRARYDFVGHGARLQVDRRDSNAIAGVAALRRV